MQIENWNINDVKPFKNNARVHEEKSISAIKASVDRFDWLAPIVVDGDGVIIAGHGRLSAAKELRLTEVPVLVADWLSDNEVAAAREADNMTQDLSYFDWDALNINLGEIDWLDIDMTEFGFKLDDELTAPEIEEDDYTEEQADEAPSRVTKGDIWQLGEHRLMCGDSTSQNDVETLMGGDKADMVFTDPPYGMNLDTDYSGMKSQIFKGGMSGKTYDAGAVDAFDSKMIDLILGLDATETFMWGADYYAELIPNKNEGSWIVWDKRANGNDDIEEDESSDKMYGSCFELCWSKHKHKRDIARVKWAGIFGMSSQDQNKRLHPTQKPLELVDWFMSRYGKKSDLVVDLFGGSGSTLIACEQLDRKCYMMELDPHYCDVIIDRWETLTENNAVKIN